MDVLYVVIILVICNAECIMGVSECYSCKKEESNDDCTTDTEECQMNDPVCETVAHNDEGVVLISKGCAQCNACENNNKNNPDECADGKVADKCTYCCYDDLCNHDVLNFTAVGDNECEPDYSSKETTGLCYSCNLETSNEACSGDDNIEECTMNDPACQTELNNVDGIVHISKRCKQSNACENNEQSNKDGCDEGKVESKCRYCCEGDLCNEGIIEYVNPVDYTRCTEWGEWTDCNDDCTKSRYRDCVDESVEPDYKYRDEEKEACDNAIASCNLECYICSEEYDNSLCDFVAQCPVGEFCQNVIENDCNGNSMITKQCQVYATCDEKTRDNPSACDDLNALTDLSDGINIEYGEQCSFCCVGDRCNGPVVPVSSLQIGQAATLKSLSPMVILTLLAVVMVI
ncbi:uncharacterized protein LOC144356285 [Saccoglossus kowalevskii]